MLRGRSHRRDAALALCGGLKAYADFATAMGKYRVKFRSPAHRTRPAPFWCIIGFADTCGDDGHRLARQRPNGLEEPLGHFGAAQSTQSALTCHVCPATSR